MGSHGAINRKEYPHQESVRIPTIFHFPTQLPTAQPERLIQFSRSSTNYIGLVDVTQPAYLQGTDFSQQYVMRISLVPAVFFEMCGNLGA